jgi:zinc transport system permease protein
LWLCVAAVVAVATRALGALPVFAFAVLPALGSLRLARRLPQALALSALLAAVSGAAGYVAAFLLELPVGASQASVAALLSGSCWALGRARG